MAPSTTWIAIQVAWGNGIIYYNTANGAAAALDALSKSAARSPAIDDKTDDEPQQDHEGLISLDCGEVFLPGERADLTLLALCDELPFPCRELGPARGLDGAVTVAMQLPGAESTHPPGAYVLATKLDKGEQEQLYRALCHDSCEDLDDVYIRMLAADPNRV